MDDSSYTAPRRGVPHPGDTPISPYDKRELRDLEQTGYKRTLAAVAEKIRGTEAHLERELQKLGFNPQDNLLDVSINEQRVIAHDPTLLQDAQLAEKSQSNLRDYYERWAELCEKHLRATNAPNSDADTET